MMILLVLLFICYVSLKTGQQMKYAMKNMQETKDDAGWSIILLSGFSVLLGAVMVGGLTHFAISSTPLNFVFVVLKMICWSLWVSLVHKISINPSVDLNTTHNKYGIPITMILCFLTLVVCGWPVIPLLMAIPVALVVYDLSYNQYVTYTWPSTQVFKDYASYNGYYTIKATVATMSFILMIVAWVFPSWLAGMENFDLISLIYLVNM